jgi:hypothetical protein
MSAKSIALVALRNIAGGRSAADDAEWLLRATFPPMPSSNHFLKHDD